MQYRAHVAQSGSPRAPVVTAVFSKRQNEVGGWRPCLLLTAITSITCVIIYFLLAPLFSSTSAGNNAVASSFSKFLETEMEPSACCRGVEHQELWGNAVKWGSDHKHNTSEGCCQSCKALCTGDGPCICNSWVYCSSPQKCGDRFGECWLKKQDDPLAPAVQDSNAEVMWTSGLVYGKEMGIIALETEHGAIRIKLLPECAPLSVAFMLEALKFRHCAGCQFYRAEGRGTIWDRQGNRVDKRQTGPPYALLQGTLEGQGIGFKEIPREACLGVKRGMVGWIGGGPDFFISLANHDEWAHKYTIFAYVLPEDISVVEKLVSLPTTPASWSGVKVSVLKDYISIKVKKIEALLLNQMVPADPLSQISTIKASKPEEKKPLQIPHVKMPAT